MRYILLLRSCTVMGVFFMPPVPPCVVGEGSTAGRLRSTGITPLPRYSAPIRHPLAFSLLPGVSGYKAYPAPAISRRGEEGFSSCSACPGHRAGAITPPKWSSRLVQPSAAHAAFAERMPARPSGLALSGPPLRSLSLRPDDSQSPQGDSVDRLQDVGFPPPCYPSYGAADSYPGRSVSC